MDLANSHSRNSPRISKRRCCNRRNPRSLPRKCSNRQPPTSGYSSDVANPAAMPTNSTAAPGSTTDLENRAAQAPQQIGQQFQNQFQPQQQDPNVPIAAQIRHSRILPQMPQLSPEQSLRLTGSGFSSEVATDAAPCGSRRKNQNFADRLLVGMGSSMMVRCRHRNPRSEAPAAIPKLTTLSQLAIATGADRGTQQYGRRNKLH